MQCDYIRRFNQNLADCFWGWTVFEVKVLYYINIKISISKIYQKAINNLVFAEK